MKSAIRILVCPLNWGLGHATRCIPIIYRLKQLGVEVFIAAEGPSKALLLQEFPDTTFIPLPSVEIQYPSGRNMIGSMLKQLPKLLKSIRNERTAINRVVHTYGLQAVISDNRYGLHTQQAFCVFITHQLFIQCPAFLRWFQGPLNQINHYFIRQFHQCWVPDYAETEQSLSGLLAHGKHRLSLVRYVGPLSRLSPQTGLPKTISVLAIISGPEPQRSIFESLCMEVLQQLPGQHVIVCGKPQVETEKTMGHIRVYSHANASQLAGLIAQSHQVICRSGYSTLMDLHRLGAKAVLVPTPGQTEQEYLARYYELRGWCKNATQNAKSISEALALNEKYLGIPASDKNTNEINFHVDDLLNQIKTNNLL